MKSNTLKKVLSIAIISIILAIVVATCVLAFVQKTLYNPATDLSDSMDNYYLLTIYKDGYTSVYHNRDENEARCRTNGCTSLSNPDIWNSNQE